MTINAIETARQEFAEREAKRASLQNALLDDTRKLAFTFVAGDEIDGKEVIRICDGLNADVDWFAKDVVKACRDWLASEERTKALPAMRGKLAELESEAGELATAAEVAFEKQTAAFAVVRNPVIRGEGDQFTETATAEDIATYRKAFNHWGTLTDRLWLARRDCRVLREEIAELSEIASRNTDANVSGPIKFKMPEIR